MPLTGQEQARLAELGRDTAHALEGALRSWRPEHRECDVAARIAAALEERGILPSVLLVGGHERRRAFRHPVPTIAVTGRDVLTVVTGVRGGLNVACSRSASAGELSARHAAACAVETALIATTRPGETWEQALAAGQAAYAATCPAVSGTSASASVPASSAAPPSNSSRRKARPPGERPGPSRLNDLVMPGERRLLPREGC
jgi:Xaa-Pro aminopeptidase